MSWVKSLLQRPSSIGQAIAPINDSVTDEQIHDIKSLFRQLVLSSSAEGRDEIFAQLLPAFEECFGNTALDRITERFGETYTLAHQAAKHLDLEVKRLGHGKEKQDAAEALLTYMRSDRCQNLLSGLTLFSRCHDDVVEEVCRSNIPSTLCKCVFLFSDLKPYLGSDAKKELQERQAVAGKLFGLLTNLVDRKAGLQELLQGNNNFTLLSRVTLSRSTNMNVIWRDGAMDVVVHMFKSSPGTKRKTRHVTLVRALQERQFMSNLIESVRRERTDVSFQMRSLRFAVELLTAVGAFSALLETDFVNAKGYEMIAKVVLSLDGELMLLRGGVLKAEMGSGAFRKETLSDTNELSLRQMSLSDTSHHADDNDGPESSLTATSVLVDDVPVDSPRLLVRNLFSALTELSLVSDKQHPPKVSLANEGYAQDASFVLPTPGRDAKVVGTLNAYIVRMEVFQRASRDWIKNEVLRSVIAVMTAEPSNYFLTRQPAPFTTIVKELDTLSNTTRIDVYKLLSYLACSVNYVPYQELVTLAEIVAMTTDALLMRLTVTLIAKLVNFDDRFTTVLRQVNVLDAFCRLMKRYVPTQPPGGVARTNTAESTGAQGHSHPNTQKSLLDTDSSDESGADSALSEDEDEAAKVVVQQSASSNSLKVRTVATKVQAIPIVLEGLSLLASYNEDNLIHFQGQQLMPGLIELVKVEDTREAALQFCARLIQRDTFLAGAVLKSLLDLSVCGKRGCSPAKRRRRSARQLLADCDMATHVLESISHLLISRASVRTLFRKNGGFAYIMTQLSDLAGYGDRPFALSLMETLAELVGGSLTVLSAAMTDNDVLNTDYMRHRVGYKALSQVVLNTRLLSKAHPGVSQYIYSFLVAMATSRTVQDATDMLLTAEVFRAESATLLPPSVARPSAQKSNLLARSQTRGELGNNPLGIRRTPPAVPSRSKRSSVGVPPSLATSPGSPPPDSTPTATHTPAGRSHTGLTNSGGAQGHSTHTPTPTQVHVEVTDGGAVWCMVYMVLHLPYDLQVSVLSLLVGWLCGAENQRVCSEHAVAELLLELKLPLSDHSAETVLGSTQTHIPTPVTQADTHPASVESVEDDAAVRPPTLSAVSSLGDALVPTADSVSQSKTRSGTTDETACTVLGPGVNVLDWRKTVLLELFRLVAQRSCHATLLRNVFLMYKHAHRAQYPHSNANTHHTHKPLLAVPAKNTVSGSKSDAQAPSGSLTAQSSILTNHYVSDSTLAAKEKSAWCTQLIQLLLRMGSVSSPGIPPFVCLNMAKRGYGGLVLPVTRTRTWPGAAYTFMAWLKIDHWCDTPQGPSTEHPVRVFTLSSPAQTWMTATISRDTQTLRIHCGKANSPAPKSSGAPAPADNPTAAASGYHGNLQCDFDKHKFRPNRWYHVGLVHSRIRLRASTATLYVNGLKVQSEKVSFMPGPPNNGSQSAGEVVCVVGTPFWQRRTSSLSWSCGPVWLVSEALSAHAVCAAYFVGPKYTGAFTGKLRAYQTYEVISARTLTTFKGADLAIYNLNNAQAAMPSEDVVEFSMHVGNTVTDSHLSATYVQRLLHGDALGPQVKSMLLSLMGNAELSCGGQYTVIRNAVETTSAPTGQMGAEGLMFGCARAHNSVCLSDGIRMVSGVPVVLDVIQHSESISDLEAGLRLLSTAVRYHANLTGQMEAMLGYQIVAMALKKRSRILSLGVVNVLFELVGTSMNVATGTLGNISAFKNLLLDYEIWRYSDVSVTTAVFSKILALITTTNSLWKFNIRRLRKLYITQRLLFLLRDETVPESAVKVVVQIIGRLLSIEGTEDDMERIARFMVTTVNPDQDVSDHPVLTTHKPSHSYAHQPPEETLSPVPQGLGKGGLSPTASNVSLNSTNRPNSPVKSSKRDSRSLARTVDKVGVTHHKVVVRNYMLEELLSFLDQQGEKALAKVLHIFGVQWVMLFVNENTDQKSLILALRLLVMFLIQAPDRPTVLMQFRKTYQGFLRLGRGLEPHARCAQLYFSLYALLLGVNISDIPFGMSLDIAALYNFFPGTLEFAEPQTLILLLELERSLQHTYLLDTATAETDLPHPASEWEIPEDDKDRIEVVGVTNIMFIAHLYNKSRHPFYFTSAFLGALIAVMYPTPLVKVTSKKRPASAGQTSSTLLETRANFGTDTLLDNTVANHIIELLVRIVLDAEPNPVRLDSLAPTNETSGGASGSYQGAYPAASPAQPKRASVHLSDGGVKGATNILDTILNAIPAIDEGLAIAFQTKLYSSIIAHVDAMSSVQLVAYLATYEGMFQHLCEVAMRMSDCVVNGTFNGPATAVWGLQVRILVDMERHASLDMVKTLQKVHRSLNVCIVSELMQTSVTSTALRDVLDDVLDIQNVVFQPSNTDVEFLETLTKILLDVLENTRAAARDGAFNLWKLMFLQKVEEMRSICTVLGEHNEVVDLYDRIFEYLMSNALDQLSAFLATHHSHRTGLTRNSSGGWLHYSKKVSSVREYATVQRRHSRSNVLQQHIRRDTKVQETMHKLRGQTMGTVESIHVYEANMFGKYRQHYVDSQNYISIRANYMFSNLWRERGLYGEEIEQDAYWKLDVIEGPARVRRRLCRNYDFVETYAGLLTDGSSALQSQQNTRAQATATATPDPCETLTQKEQEVISELSELSDFKVFSADTLMRTGAEAESEGRESIEVTGEAEEKGTEEDPQTDSKDGNAPADTAEDEAIGSESDDDTDEDFKEEDMTIMRQLEPGDAIQFCFNCSRIQGLDAVDSVLLLCKRNIYIIDGYRYVYDAATQKSTIMEMAAAVLELGDNYRPIVPKLADNFGATDPEATREVKTEMGDDSGIIKCPYKCVQEVHKRRFLLREVAVEIFSDDGRDHLLAFVKSDRDNVYKKLIHSTVGSFSKSISKGIMDVAGQTLVSAGFRDIAEESKGVFSQLWGERSPTQRWVAGELSNFQYLMWINTWAGRSYNDLTQYPVFPWILADYDSETLDLNDPKTFRDLSKPMGNQTPERAQYYTQRYNNWEDPTGETPPFHYGTHFSSAMIVASYLIRMEPYTQMFLTLQGGHFDHPDRMFHSIKEAWESASRHNTADVKELIPEFFYLPEFLVNSNKFGLGKRQTGETLDDVTLPAWAKGDVHEFIRVHREALESPYVSANLHQWIDLVFGYRQTGEEALKAMNVFHHLSYEGAVDIDQITDPVLRQAVIGIINNFGQTPRQVFKKPHPSRKSTLAVSSPQTANAGEPTSAMPRTLVYFPEQLKRSIVATVKVGRTGAGAITCNGGVGDIIVSDKGVVALGQQQLAVYKGTNRYLSWEYGDNSLRLMRIDNGKTMGACENMHVGCLSAVTFADEQVLITGGEDSCVSVWQFADQKTVNGSRTGVDVAPKILQILHGHTKRITAIAASRPYSIIVSGSGDKTCIVWDLNQMDYIRQLRGHPDTITAIAINNQTGNIVTCSRSQIRLWTVNGTCLAIKNIYRTDLDITSCVVSEGPEWETTGVFITGHANGAVCVWRIAFRLVEPLQSDSEDLLFLSTDTTTDTQAHSSPGMAGSNNGTGVDTSSGVDKTWERKFVNVTTLASDDDAVPVTSLKLARDHKRLYVGDSSGCVSQWALPASGGAFQSDWESISDQEFCSLCESPFSAAEPEVECQDCRGHFCGRCARFSAILPLKGIFTPETVCRNCYVAQYGATIGVTQWE